MPATEHAALGASGAHRWMECPGSVQLSEDVPSRPTSEYALRGSAAHEVAERCLITGKDAGEYVGGDIDIVDDGEIVWIEVTEEMTDAVQVYLDHVRESVPTALPDNSPNFFGVEVQFSLEKLDPPAPMFGTADAVYWDAEEKTLDVFDYKHGRGVVVEAEDNPQLAYYALGAVLDLHVRPETIRVTIVQPRAGHSDGPVRTWEFGFDTLIGFKSELLEAAEEAASDDPRIGPIGDHCRWCPAKAICPAQQDAAKEAAQTAFSTADPGESLPAQVEDGKIDPVPPEELPEETLVDLLRLAEHVEDYFKDAREYAQNLMEQGADLPGFKLVPKRPRRYWNDKEEAEEWLRKRFLVSDIFKKKLVSPYQAEQLLKDRPRTEIPDGFIEKKSSGLKLVPESHPKPAVTPGLQAAEKFDVITTEEDTDG